jgi:hypothetical protein
MWLKWHLKFFEKKEIKIIYEKRNSTFDIREFLKVRNCEEIDIFEIGEFSSIEERINLGNDEINKLQKKLFEKYKIVCFTDQDEFLFHTDLKSILINTDFKILKPKGLEIIQDIHKESSFDQNLKLMQQRSFCGFHPYYSKPIIVKEPVYWEVGRHRADSNDHIELENLYLIHLGKFDINYLINLNIENQKIGGFGYHDKFKSREDIIDWFVGLEYYQDQSNPKLFEIPRVIKDCFDI